MSKKRSKVIRVPGELVDKVERDIALLRLRQSQEKFAELEAIAS